MSTTPDILTPHGSTPTGVLADAAGYPALTWSAEKPKAAGWWWLRRKGQDLCGRPVWGHGQIVAVYPDYEGLFYLNGIGGGTAAVIRIKTLSAEWAEWAGPLPEPHSAPLVESPDNKELCGGASQSASATVQPKP